VQQVHDPIQQIPHVIAQGQHPMEVIDLNFLASMGLDSLVSDTSSQVEANDPSNDEE
jgi:hypothetical protein